MSRSKKSSTRGPGHIRLIAGQWRGRKLPVPDLDGLRPSGARGRETLFNWLHPYLPGARCADLFAGCGALGFEAGSRGVESVALVEISPLAISALLESRSLLQAEQISVHRSNALQWLRGQPKQSLDIVFIDPPFGGSLASQSLEALQQLDSVAPGGLVYVEMPEQLPGLEMEAPFELWREKVLGGVRMRVFQRRQDS
jgi:16S rRNA (guanine966-N2)-methyltransferase